MDSSRRSFDRSRDTGVKRAWLTDEPNIRDPRLLRATPADVQRYRKIEREDGGNDLYGGGYHPTHQLFSDLVNEYRRGLAELVVNSKPVITNLTIIAGENLHAAKSIAEAICSHIIEVPSEQKLPSLYLLDSIVKNIGRDYIKYFSTKLPEVFCKAYKQADPSIHAGLRHLFRTWEGVFPLQPLQIIEKELGISLSVNGSGSVSARSKPEPQSQYPQKSIHVNPKYLEARQKLQPPSRVKGLTNDSSSNILKSTGNAARLSIQHREPARDSMYEKEAEVAFDDYDYGLKKSSISEHDKHWYGTGTNMAENVVGHRNGYDGKHKVASYATSQSHISRTSGGMPRTWKNNEEEEYLWDDINSSVIKHSTPTDLRKDNMGFDESDDMETDGDTLSAATNLQSIQSPDHARVLGVSSGGAGSSIARKAHQPQMIRNPVTGASARSQTNNRTTNVQKQPPQPILHQRSPSPSFDLPVSQSMQRSFPKSSEMPRAQLKRDSTPLFSQTGKKQHLDSQKSKESSSAVLSTQQRMLQHSFSDHSRSDGKLPKPISEALASETTVAEAVQHLTSSGLLSAMLNSGVLSKGVSIPKLEVDAEGMLEPLHTDVHPAVRSGVAQRQVPSSEMSVKPLTKSSKAIKPASVHKRVDVVSQTTSSKTLPRKEREEKTAAANPYSNLFSTLMEKGLITSSKSDSSTTPLPSKESEAAIPGVISRPLMAKIVPDSSSNSSLFSGNNLSAVDNVSSAPEVKSLIGYEFKPSLIRQLHEPVIEYLIDSLPYRCNICGLRLKIQESLDKHMEWHSSKGLDNEYCASRRWFPDLDDWVSGHSCTAVDPVDSAEETEEDTVEDESCLVSADENQCVCILCGELFEDYYSHDEDRWMFRGAMNVKYSGLGNESTIASDIPSRDLIIVHPECFTESSARQLGLVANVKVEEDA